MTSLVRQEVFCIGKVVILELIRRKYLFVMGALIAVFCLCAIGIRIAGVEDAVVSAFVLNLGLTMAYGLSHLMTLLLAARQIPDELQNRTLYPILARPVTRGDLILGKWGASAFAGVLAYLIFLIMVCVATPNLSSTDTLLFMQMLILHLGSICVIAAHSILLSLILPKAVSVLLIGIAFFAYGTIKGVLQSVFASGPLGPLVEWVMLYFPDYGKLNMVTRYTDGISGLDGPLFLGLLLYMVAHAGIALLLSYVIFKRKSL